MEKVRTGSFVQVEAVDYPIARVSRLPGHTNWYMDPSSLFALDLQPPGPAGRLEARGHHAIPLRAVKVTSEPFTVGEESLWKVVKRLGPRLTICKPGHRSLSSGRQGRWDSWMLRSEIMGNYCETDAIIMNPPFLAISSGVRRRRLDMLDGLIGLSCCLTRLHTPRWKQFPWLITECAWLALVSFEAWCLKTKISRLEMAVVWLQE